MNKEWSEINKTIQLQLKKKESFDEGIATLLLLRKNLMKQILEFRKELSEKDFSAIPFKNANGYHSKSIAYSLWHIFRIEDIVVNTLIAGKKQVFFEKDYKNLIRSPIITTGNELKGDEIAEFFGKLNIDELYNYIRDVDTVTRDILKSMSYEDIKVKISDDKKKELTSLDVVSKSEDAYWLIDYWCGKDVKGLIQMPLSRHWIMHIEACMRIRDKIISIKGKEKI
ncbi:MAG: phage head-tail adapter protein [Ruminococcaceae bacterium]|nr:phage head-tail adapter protein [Oscillospiraceae bacterium]